MLNKDFYQYWFKKLCTKERIEQSVRSFYGIKPEAPKNIILRENEYPNTQARKTDD